MPKHYEMSWEGSPKNRWVKMYRGARYRVTCQELGAMVFTQEGSYKLANAWWKKKKADIDGADGIPGVADPVRRTLEAYSGEPVAAKPDADKVARKLMAEFPTLPQEAMQAIVGAMRGHVDPSLVRPSVVGVHQGEQSIGVLVDKYLSAEQIRERAGKIGGGRAVNNRQCLNHFRDWIGADTHPSAITGLKWQDWHAFLSTSLESGHWGESYVSRIYSVSKRFVRTLWEWELIALPRNLDSSKLGFTVSPKAIKVVADDDLIALLKAVKGQTYLHALLMLNCGFTAKDVNDLRHDEVDWTNGIIERKRSKTAKHENVPIVRYKLWQQTFELLNLYRSEDPEIALLTTKGHRWIQEHQKDGRWHRSDSIRSCFRNAMTAAGVKGCVKQLRATAATAMGTHPEYKAYCQYFLGHAPSTIAEKHYVVPNETEFFAALAWLESALGLKGMQGERGE